MEADAEVFASGDGGNGGVLDFGARRPDCAATPPLSSPTTKAATTNITTSDNNNAKRVRAAVTRARRTIVTDDDGRHRTCRIIKRPLPAMAGRSSSVIIADDRC